MRADCVGNEAQHDILSVQALSYSPEAVKGSPGVFLFKERKMPESAAVHQIMITYYDGQYELFSNVVSHSFHSRCEFEDFCTALFSRH